MALARLGAGLDALPRPPPRDCGRAGRGRGPRALGGPAGPPPAQPHRRPARPAAGGAGGLALLALPGRLRRHPAGLRGPSRGRARDPVARLAGAVGAARGLRRPLARRGRASPEPAHLARSGRVAPVALLLAGPVRGGRPHRPSGARGAAPGAGEGWARGPGRGVPRPRPGLARGAGGGRAAGRRAPAPVRGGRAVDAHGLPQDLGNRAAPAPRPGAGLPPLGAPRRAAGLRGPVGRAAAAVGAARLAGLRPGLGAGLRGPGSQDRDGRRSPAGRADAGERAPPPARARLGARPDPRQGRA